MGCSRGSVSQTERARRASTAAHQEHVSDRPGVRWGLCLAVLGTSWVIASRLAWSTAASLCAGMSTATSLTLSEVSRLTGFTRATCRRILLTLEKLGHVRSDGRSFMLTPRVLTLGWAYLTSLNLSELAQPLMEDLVERTRERAQLTNSTG